MKTTHKTAPYDRWIAELNAADHMTREELLSKCHKLAQTGGMLGVIAAVVLARETAKIQNTQINI